MAFGDFAGNNGIVVPEYESIFSRLVPDNAEFGIHIVLHLVVITIQMVRRYIQQDGDVRLEVVHVIELETTQFDNVDGVRIFSHLEGQAVPDVPGKPSIHSRLPEDVVSQHGRRRLAIAPGDTDHLGIRVPSGKFYFGDDRRTFLLQFLYDRSLVGNPRTLDDFVGIQDVGFGMPALFPTDTVGIQHILILGFDGREIGNEHIESFRLCQHGGTCATFTGP